MQSMDIKQLLKILPYNEISQRDDIVIVDIRSPAEFAHEHIPGAINIPVNKLNALDPQTYSDKIALFHCRSGTRTDLNKAAIDATPFKEKYCINGGITAWEAANLTVNKQAVAAIDVMQQSQIIASLFILLGIGLSHLLSPYFIILALMPGVGLMISGLTGFCAMAKLLQYMPWNKVN
jgi:rhodanese-related sulfurtransferase